MRRLYAQIALGVALAVAAGWMSVGLLVPRFQALIDEGLRERMLGGGLRWVAARIDERPQAEWPQMIAEARRHISIPLEIVAAEALPRETSAAEPGEPMFAQRDGGPPSIYFPLDNGSHYLAAGPMPPPPTAPLVITALVFTLVLTIAASAIVGIPLVRRLRTLRHAIRELGRGNWAVRLDPRAEGALSDLAGSVNRTAMQLQQQFQEREALLQAVSHEIGTPLSRMRFQLELLEARLESGEHRERLRALGKDLDELDELSTELVSWMETDSGTSTTRAFDVRTVLESLIELEQPRSRDSPQVTLAAPPGAIVLHADQRRFERAIENLLRNALRYAQRCVVVDVTPGTGYIVVEVRDDGPGIPRDQWTKVLEPFARIEGLRSHAHRGLGLGLAIVRRIVEAHGGEVSVANAPEGGTRIRTTWRSYRSTLSASRIR